MFKGEIELEAELEDLMSILAESETEFEIEAELTPAKRTRGREVASDQIRAGVTDENRVTDAIFYDLHPTWKDKRLPSNAARAIKDEWIQIRNLIVRPMLQEMACSGWESDPESFAKRAAEHHLGVSARTTRIVRTANPPNWACNVSVDRGDGPVVLTVQLSPAEKLVRVGPASGPSGQMMCYKYRCVAANLVFESSVCSGSAPQPELEAELEDLMALLASSDLQAEAEVFAVPRLVFDLQCAACADGQCVACQDQHCAACPVARGDCRTVLNDAIGEAIRLANNAADRVEAAIRVRAELRDGQAQRTAQLFHLVFCHDPLETVPWAGGPSGASVAQRFRAVAHELDFNQGQRRMRFICRPARVDCRQADPAESTCCTPNDNAFTVPGIHSTIFLCPLFWTDQNLEGLPDLSRRGGTILHEMLHNLYDLDDSMLTGRLNIPTPRRFDAHCYKAFALWISDLSVEQFVLDACNQRACAV